MSEHAPDPSLPWVPRVLLRVEVGSTAHGTGTVDQEDYDEIGVMAIPWQQSIGVPVQSERAETIVYRPGKAVGERSGPGDYDLSVHSARKFCRLTAAGNPSMLVALFGPVRYLHPTAPMAMWDDEWWTSAFWHEGARAKFLGYCRAQRQRLEGVRGGKHTNRPELIERYGFDTKYAMHMLRLGFQGVEYMTTGRITLPMVAEHREWLQAVRTGQIPLDIVLKRADALEDVLSIISSRAPQGPRWKTINSWLSSVYDWQRSQSCPT